MMDAAVIILLILLIILGYNTLRTYKENIHVLTNTPCDLCREQGHLVLNNTWTSRNTPTFNYNYSINLTEKLNGTNK